MEENNYCTECGMITNTGEYHPYAACLLFKACGSGYEVRNQLQYIAEHAQAESARRIEKEIIHILDGIDKDEVENESGWWETSTGAEFGKGILDQIKAYFEFGIKK